MPKLPKNDNCIGCGACQDVCPFNAIILNEDLEGFKYPNIDISQCKECGNCTKICPSLKQYNIDKKKIICYASKCKDTSLRLKSSSGGIFPVLAKYILNIGGSIYGCCYDKDLMAKHIRITKENELDLLCGSKYLQSNTIGIFKLVKKDILSRKLVLFTGTPCQIAAIKIFLGKNIENLLTMEVICHGVPSPFVWKRYLEDLKKDIPWNPSWKISARDKYVSWRRYSMMVTNGEKTIRECFTNNIFMKIFLHNLCLRPSCYQCQFKQSKSGADITVGDFWGIEELKQYRDDDKGVSAVIINTDLGEKVWQEIMSDIDYQVCSLDDITKNNPAYLFSVKMPRYRDYFMKNFKNRNLKQLLLRCTLGPWYIQYFNKIYHFYLRIKHFIQET
jgi:coenzyme F420-reducing hydrogenase beta subunit